MLAVQYQGDQSAGGYGGAGGAAGAIDEDDDGKQSTLCTLGPCPFVHECAL